MTEETKPDESAANPPLAPGRGAPIIPGPPMSVGPPIPARTFNVAAQVWVVAAVVLVILVLIVVAGLLRPR